MKIEKLSSNPTLKGDDLLELLSVQFQIAFAFRGANAKGKDPIEFLSRLVKEDSLIAGYIVAIEMLIQDSNKS